MGDTGKLLATIYYDIGGEGSFSSVETLYKIFKKRYPEVKITKKTIREWLNKSYVYLRHKKVVKPRGTRHPTVPILTSNAMEKWDCDTAIFLKSTMPYALVCSDLFTSKLFVQPMKHKMADSTAKAFEKIINEQSEGRIPNFERTDAGGEYAGGAFPKLLKSRKIRHSITDASQKASAAERGIAKLRSKIEKVRTYTGKTDWTSHWREIVKSINETPLSKIQLAPNEINLSNAGYVFQKRYGNYLKRETPKIYSQIPKFPVGSTVRISLTKSSLFQKGSKPSVSAEVFVVREFRSTSPPTYLLSDSDNQPVKAPFYEHELIPTEPDFQLHKRLSKIYKRQVRPSKRFEVTYKEHPPTLHWISETELQQYRTPFQHE